MSPLVQTVRTLRFEYQSLESKQDQLCIQIADYKNQLEYKDLVAKTAVISLGTISSLSSVLFAEYNFPYSFPYSTNTADFFGISDP